MKETMVTIIEYSKRETINSFDCNSIENLALRLALKCNHLGLIGHKITSLKEVFNYQTGYENLIIESEKEESK